MKKRTMFARLGAVMAAVALMFGISVGSAQATVYGVHIQHSVSGKCLDSNQYGQVYFNPCQHGNGYQTWTVWQGSNGEDQIQNAQTNLCLATGNQNGNITIQTWTCNTAYHNEYWHMQSGNFGDTFLNDLQSPIHCLDGNGSSVYATYGWCNPANQYQNWYLTYP